MKKLIVIVMGVMILSMAVVGVASANNGPHGGYTNFTDACAGCHRAHTGQNEFLLVAPTVYDLCVVCHGSSGGGANTDVVDGIWVGYSAGYVADPKVGQSGSRNADYLQGTGGRRLNGGSFGASGGIYGTQSSRHTVEGLPTRLSSEPALGTDGKATGDGNAWGAWNAATTGTDGWVSGTLECTSCHNPHGSSNYRILNDVVPSNSRQATVTQWESTSTYVKAYNSTDGNTYNLQVENVNPAMGQFQNNLVKKLDDVTSNPAGSKGYTYVADTLVNDYANGAWNNDQVTAKPISAAYGAGMSFFCTACHLNYGKTNHSTNGTSTNPTANIGNPLKGPWGPANVGDGITVTRYSHKTYDTSGTARVNVSGTRTAGNLGHPEGNPLPFASAPSTGADPTSTGYFTCLTCHFAHGSTQTMGGFANSAGFGQVDTGIGGVAPTNDSANLFYPNRGTCRSCHWTQN